MRERGFPVSALYPAARHRMPRPRAGSLRWPPYQYSARGSAFPSAACSNHAIRARVSAIRRSNTARLSNSSPMLSPEPRRLMTAGPGRTGERAIVHHGIERIAEFRPAL